MTTNFIISNRGRKECVDRANRLIEKNLYIEAFQELSPFYRRPYERNPDDISPFDLCSEEICEMWRSENKTFDANLRAGFDSCISLCKAHCPRSAQLQLEKAITYYNSNHIDIAINAIKLAEICLPLVEGDPVLVSEIRKYLHLIYWKQSRPEAYAKMQKAQELQQQGNNSAALEQLRDCINLIDKYMDLYDDTDRKLHTDATQMSIDLKNRIEHEKHKQNKLAQRQQIQKNKTLDVQYIQTIEQLLLDLKQHLRCSRIEDAGPVMYRILQISNCIHYKESIDHLSYMQAEKLVQSKVIFEHQLQAFKTRCAAQSEALAVEIRANVAGDAKLNGAMNSKFYDLLKEQLMVIFKKLWWRLDRQDLTAFKTDLVDHIVHNYKAPSCLQTAFNSTENMLQYRILREKIEAFVTNYKLPFIEPAFTLPILTHLQDPAPAVVVALAVEESKADSYERLKVTMM